MTNIGQIALVGLSLMVGCTAENHNNNNAADDTPQAGATSAPAAVSPFREAYYGDLHLHTSNSLDAYWGGGAVDSIDAYRFAAGEPVDYFGKYVVRRRPLDFIAITDHSEYLGVLSDLENVNSPNHRNAADRAAFLRAVFSRWGAPGTEFLPDELAAVSRSVWEREIDIANQHYQPGRFTTFIAYEWTAGIDGGDIHRNVIFRGAMAPDPFTFLDSNHPEDLWDWLDRIRDEGYEAIAIPHNGNTSNGAMYSWFTSDGDPVDEIYAAQRQKNEPLTEIAQSKGQSEVHPLLAPTDEFADFEVMETWSGIPPTQYRAEGSYVRDGLARGVVLYGRLGVNPFKYGMVGGSDIHTGLSVSAQQDWNGNFWKSGLGGGELSREEADNILNRSTYVLNGPGTTAGALTGVWAESNTRESIYSALRRRETFATTGSRLKVRFFGGWHFNEDILKQKGWVAMAYADGVPMGSGLPTKSESVGAPKFVVWAIKDADGANLDRLQIIKGWDEDGKQREKVFDVAWSGDRTIAPDSNRLSAVGNTVDRKAGTYTNSLGATELKTVWTDPDFDSDQNAMYYVRVLEIPTPRWSLLLAVKHDLPLPESVAAFVQQRGWSSPIWYQVAN